LIVTFYSYKGGVGRSMALANVASLLARRGLRVLMIDFDLEAPGLEQFFPINQPGIRRAPGLLDLLLAYKQTMSLAAEEEGEEPSFMRLEETFLQPVYKSLDPGRLDLLHAGQREGADQLAGYAYNLRNFDWQDFYFNWAGEAFFEWLRQALVPKLYDLVLVDSRTGVTEMGGICAYQLADAIVMFCAANHQNVEGTLNVVGNFFSPAVKARRQNRPLQVLVIPSRIEQRDGPLLEDFRERFKSKFAQYVPPSLQQAELGFWDLLIPYESSYAFEERVVEQRSAGEKPSGDGSPPITAAFERLAQAIARLAGPETALGKAAAGPEEAPAAQAEPLRDLTRSFAGYDVFLSFYQGDAPLLQPVVEWLSDRGLTPFVDKWELVDSETRRERTQEALFQSRACLIFLGSAGIGPWQEEEIRAALDRHVKIIPVLLPPPRPEGVPPLLANLAWVDFQQGFDPQALSRLLAETRETAPGPARSTVVTGAPYRGLEPFREQDAQFFFGRQQVVQEMIDKLREGARLVGLAGASGSGKTSLVQAGLFPILRSGAVPGSDFWPLATLSLGTDPLMELAATLGPLLAAGSPFLLFIDQFEVLFSVCSPEERRAFLARLLPGLEKKDSPLRAVIAIREDFLGACLEEPRLARFLESHLITVRPLPREELRKAIEEPAQRAGIAFEAGLVERILDDVGDVPGALPLLQALLDRLWRRQQRGFLTASAYDQMGGVRGVIAYQAEEVYARLTSAEQRIARRLLLRLVHTGEGVGDTGRRAALSELHTLHKDPSNVEKVLGVLVDAGLVVVSATEDQASAELAHEILLRSWPRLQKWIKDNRQFLLWRGRLRVDVLNWQEGRSGLLWGAALTTAVDWLRDRENDLTLNERKFIEASLEKERLRRRRLWLQRAALAAGVLGVSFLVWMYLLATQTSKAALSRQLAAQSTNALESNLSLALLLGVEALNADDTMEARRSLLAALDYGAMPRPAPASEHDASVESVALSPDGSLLASGSDDGALILWDVAKQSRLLGVLPSHPPPAVDALAFSPDGRRLAAGRGNDIVLFDVTGGVARSLPGFTGHQKQVESLAFSPDGRLLASGADDGQVLLWDVANGKLLRRIGSHSGEVDSVAFSPNGRMLASGSEDQTVKLWSIDGGEPLSTFTGHTAGVDALAFSPDAMLLASGSDDQSIILWHVRNRRSVRQLTGHQGGVKGIAFTQDGEVLVSGGQDRSIRFWSVATGSQISRPLTDPEGSVESISLSRDGTLLASGGAGRQVLLWDMAPRPFLGRLVKVASEPVSSIAFSPDGKWLATGIDNQFTGSKNPGLLVWDLAARPLVGRPLAGHKVPIVFSVAFDPKGGLASGGADGSIFLWDLTSGQRRELTDLHSTPVLALAFSPNGRQLASGGLGRDVVLLDLESETRQELKRHFGSITALTFSPGGKLLASGSEDKTVLLWDVASSEPRLLFKSVGKSIGVIWSLSFSRDGKKLAVGGETGITLFDVKGSGLNPSGIFQSTPAASLAFSPDGKMLASGSQNDVSLWDIEAERSLHLLSGHAGSVRSIAFSPDGKLLASAGNDGSFILWETDPQAWIARACKAAKRKELTPEEWKKYLVDQSRRKTC
jgi:WD40 repeat protein